MELQDWYTFIKNSFIKLSAAIFFPPKNTNSLTMAPITANFLIEIKPDKQLTMREMLLIKKLLLCIGFLFFIVCARAQVTVVTGPSDHTTSPPTSASNVNQVLGFGGNISIKIGSTTSTTATNIIYQWYKIDSTGVKRLVQSSNNGVYTENTAGAGYYTYQLVVSNSNQCSSDISDPFKVYVLPVLNPTIAASSATICSNGTSASTLTANPGNSSFSYLYQWSLNGAAISGATSATYTTTATTTGSNTYSLKVSYALSSANYGTATQTLNIIPVPTKPAISVGQ